MYIFHLIRPCLKMASFITKPALLYSILVISFNSVIASISTDEHHEELLIKPLNTGHLYSHFQFTTKWDVDRNEKGQHYRLFPKSFGEVLDEFSVQEMHLSLTQGQWRHEKWGYPVQPSPTGAELWVWFKEGTRSIDLKWSELINVLSGMFCASLNFMDSRSSVTPKYSFRPTGASSPWYNKRFSNHVRYAQLPHEIVCTENLTPWKKLLPCSNKAGLGTVFNAIKLFDATYHSLGVHYRPLCQDYNCTSMQVELTQSLSVVFDVAATNKGSQDWSIRKLFDRPLSTSCPLAKTSKVYVDVSKNRTLEYYFLLSPPPTSFEKVRREKHISKYAVYDLPEIIASTRILDLRAKYNKNVMYPAVAEPLLHASRYQTGYGQEKGGIATILYNHHSEDIMVVVMETVPWYLRLYFHTLEIKYYPLLSGTHNGTVIKPTQIHYIPGRDRERSYQMELLLRLPANSMTKISMQFDRALLTWTEYPPDANHGFYVNSAIITAMLPTAQDFNAFLERNSSIIGEMFHHNTSGPYFLSLHTESLLVTLPTPDFSMPYNVICLACTVVAIAFGSVHNLSTRKFTTIDPAEQKGLLTKVKGYISKLRNKRGKENVKPENDEENEELTKETGDMDVCT